MMDDKGDKSEIENIHVYVRVRPLNQREIDNGCEKITFIDPTQQQIVVKKPNSSTDLCKAYNFDCVFPDVSTQTDMYYRTSHHVVDKVLQGYNGTIFAYGQTGTGKTYTMCGKKDSNLRGIMPNTFSHIFNHISNSEAEFTFLVHVTYLEIYNENVRDLLAKHTKKPVSLEVREHAELGVFVENLSGYIVNNLEELERLLEIGNKNRVVGSTDMNFSSSRSHTIFTITLESSNKKTTLDSFTRGKLHLVDLAGSERQTRSRTSGLRLKEASKINQSLLVLGNVISSLVDGKYNHIPYRNSKLTRLLQDSLGGNSKTVMIATISPSEFDFEETISSLRYANRAKNIQNRTFINEQGKDTLLKGFQQEIEKLRKQLESLTVENVKSESDDSSTKRKTKTKKSSTSVSSQDSINLDEVTEEIFRAREESRILREKLQQLKDKILIGGQNLQKCEEMNENMIKCAQSKIDSSLKRQEELKLCLKQCEEQRILIAKKYSTAQEEVANKTKELRRLNSYINNAKLELAELQQEQEQEMENILETVQDLNRELQLHELLINKAIPPKYRELIKQNIRWNEEIGAYHLKFIAYTGNNLQKRGIDTKKKFFNCDLPECHNPFKQYRKSNRKIDKTHDVPLKLPNIYEKPSF